jgi:hypothetical protein
MARIVVTAAQPGAGKTGVAAAIARHYAYEGIATTLVRTPGDPPGNAAADAAYFASLDFAPGSPATPSEVPADPGEGTLVVVEADTPDAVPGAPAVLVAHTLPGDGTIPAGTLAIVLTRVPASALDALPGDVGGVPVITLPEDRILAGFGLDELRSLLNAETLVEGEDDGSTCDHLVIAPIASDAGQPYFRRFPSKAVVVRFDKTDMHLAAIQTEPRCLVLTGGRMPSDYLFDVARARGVPVVLSQTDTENTVIALEHIFDRTRFQGARKLNRMAELLEGSRIFTGAGVGGA